MYNLLYRRRVEKEHINITIAPKIIKILLNYDYEIHYFL